MVNPEITASNYPIFGKELLKSCYIICMFGSSASFTLPILALKVKYPWQLHECSVFCLLAVSAIGRRLFQGPTL
jgi:hypothetical protein